jgi:hypothetical protein
MKESSKTFHREVIEAPPITALNVPVGGRKRRDIGEMTLGLPVGGEKKERYRRDEGPIPRDEAKVRIP